MGRCNEQPPSSFWLCWCGGDRNIQAKDSPQFVLITLNSGWAWCLNVATESTEFVPCTFGLVIDKSLLKYSCKILRHCWRAVQCKCFCVWQISKCSIVWSPAHGLWFSFYVYILYTSQNYRTDWNFVSEWSKLLQYSLMFLDFFSLFRHQIYVMSSIFVPCHFLYMKNILLRMRV